MSPGFGLIYCGLSSEPGPTGSGLGPFQLYTAYTNLLCNVRVWELTIVADAKGNCDSNDTDDDDSDGARGVGGQGSSGKTKCTQGKVEEAPIIKDPVKKYGVMGLLKI